jgi:hypothetical protein
VFANTGGAAFMSVGTTTTALFGISGSSDNDLFVVGALGAVQNFNGSMLSKQTGYSGSDILRSVHAPSATDAWIVGDQGTTLHFNGTMLAQFNAPTNQSLQAVFELAPNNVWAVGLRGTILHWAA